MKSISQHITIDQFVGILRAKGILLKVDREDNLDIDAPKGMLEKPVLEAIRQRKQELVAYLKSITAPAVSDQPIPLAPEAVAYQLSSSQMNVWVMNEIWNDHALYNIDSLITWQTAFDKELFEQAIRLVIERHEILRTIFKEDEQGTIRQWILPAGAVPFTLPLFDCRDDEHRFEKVEQLMREDANKVFDLRTGPLLRMTAYRMEEETYYLHYTMHHIISDGWSLTVLINEVFSYYESLKKGRLLQQPPLRFHYKDYAAWQQQQLTTPAFAAHKQYWLGQLQQEWQLLELSTGRQRPLMQSTNGYVYRTLISSALTDQLRQFCLLNKGSLFIGLLSFIRIFLYRYTTQTDLLIGTPVAGRNHPDLHNQIGFYINTLALRTPLEAGGTFTDLFNCVRVNTMNAFEHQDYPFNQLLEDLALKRNQGRSALFDVMISLQNFNENTDRSYVNRVSENVIQDAGIARASYDLFFDFEEMGSQLDMRLKFNSDIYDKAAMYRFMQHFLQLLEAVLQQPFTPVSRISYLTREEQQQLLTGFNQLPSEENAAPGPTLIELFSQQVAAHPEVTALAGEKESFTYSTLDELSGQLAAFLVNEYGLQPEDRAGILLPRGEWMVIAVLAVLKAGGAYVPIDPDYPATRIAYIVENAACRVCMDEALLEKFNKERSRYAVAAPVAGITEHNLAYIIYTSGSTGLPKGVMMEHKAVVNLVAGLNAAIYNRYEGNLKVALIASLSFDASVQQLFGALLNGHTLYVVPGAVRQSGALLWNYYKQHNIDISDGTPSHLFLLSNEAMVEGVPVRHFIIGGEALPVKLVNQFYNLYGAGACPAISNVYGPTETCVDTTSYTVTAPVAEETGIVLIGRPFPHTQIFILDAAGQLQPIGIAGELYIGGRQLARGYWQQPELTAAKFIEHPYQPGAKLYRTGDLARWLPDGTIEYIGRTDDQVKIRGYRIETGEVEHALLQLVNIKAAIVTVHYEADGQAALAGYLVSDEELVITKLRNQLLSLLPAYMIPAYLVQVAELPLTTHGKVDRKLLPLPNEAALDSGVVYVPPGSALEAALVAVYGQVLNRNRVGMRDNFFELGGDSIKAIQLISRLKQKGFTAKVEDVLRYPVVEALALQVSALQPSLPVSTVPVTTPVPEALQALVKDGEIESVYELSPLQEGIYYHWLADPKSAVYVQQASYRLQGELDIATLRQSYQYLVNRHAILRTSFTHDYHNKNLQLVWKNCPANFLYQQLEAGAAIENECSTYKEQDRIAGFDISKGSQMRLSVLELAPGQFEFVWTHHHILMDGWCAGILVNEFYTIYRSLLKGVIPPLKPVYPYVNYINWLSGIEKTASMHYWKNYLTGYETLATIPFGDAEGATGNYMLSEQLLHLEEAQVKAIRQLCKRLLVTESTFIQSVWGFLLSRYNNTTDVVFGSVVSGRPAELDGVEDMIGLFINTIPVRVQYRYEMTCKDLLKQVQQEAILALPHHYIRLSDIQLQSALRNHLFDQVLGYLNYPEQPELVIEEGEKGLEQLEVLSQQAINQPNNHFNIIAFSTPQGMLVIFRYNAAVYTEAAIRLVKEHFSNLVQLFVENIDRQLGSIDYLSAAERHQLLHLFNNTPASYPADTTIVDLFHQQVAKGPDQVALVYEGLLLSYRTLDEQTNRLARYLQKQGVTSGTVVPVCLDRSAELVIALLAVLKAGGVYVPVDPAYPQERISFMLSDTGSAIIIAHTYYSELLEENKQATCIYIDRDWTLFEMEPALPPVALPDSNSLAYVIYTSGSTGRPKGVPIAHGAVINLIHWYIGRYGVTPGSHSTAMAGVGFDAFALEVWSALLSGSALYVLKDELKLDAEALLSFYADEGITHAFVPPALIGGLVNSIQPPQLKLRYVLVGGDRLPQLPIDRVSYTLVNQYGPTETTILVTDYFVNTLSNKLPPIGKPIANTELYVLDSARQLVPVGVAGELYIGGVPLAQGYLNRPALTAEKFVAHPFKPGKRLYRSGDLVRWLPDGNLEYIGRLDEQVKIRGHRVEVGEVEYGLQQLPGITGAVIVIHKDTTGQAFLVGYYTGDLQQPEATLRQQLQQVLPDYMVPVRLIRVENFPLTAHGKVDRQLLPDPLEEGLLSVVEYAAPRNAIEEALTKVYGEVLNREKVSIQESFFDLGGDSIKAILLINRLKQQGYTVKVGDVLKYPVVAELALRVQVAVQQVWQGAVTGDTPLTPVQYWFLSSSYAYKHHYNQSVMLYSREVVDELLLSRCLELLTRHHDGLRMRYELDALTGNWRQYTASIEEKNYELYCYDEQALAAPGKSREALSDELQGSFDLSTGPLLKVCLFRAVGKTDELLLIAHHLVIDGVSWRILLEDLSVLYGQLQQGGVGELPLKSDSFQSWSLRLQTYAGSADIQQQRPYWSRIVSLARQHRLPVDQTVGANTQVGQVSENFTLDADLTTLLTNRINRVYRTEINDVLLCALGWAVWQNFDRSSFWIELEGHGREELFTDVSIARTTGWFTNTYPLVLQMQVGEEITDYLAAVKETLRQVPQKGIGYGLLRYGQHNGDELHLPAEGITFNYLGDFGSGIAAPAGKELFGYADAYRGQQVNSSFQQPTMLTVTGLVAGNQLHVSVSYSSGQYYKNTIAALCEHYRNSLTLLIKTLAAEDKRYLTPADVTYREIRADELQTIAKEGEIEDIYTLSPLQEGIYYHWLSGTTAYVEQTSYRLQGQLEMAVLKKSFEYLVERHAILRTSFSHQYGSRTIQVVRKAIPVDFRHLILPVEYDAEQYCRQYKQQDRMEGFNLATGSQIRLAIIELANHQYEFVWTHHHILMDGWCISVLVQEFYSIYNNLLNGKQPSLTPTPSYVNYINWLNRLDQSQSYLYWQQYLAGYDDIATLPFKQKDLPDSAYIPKEVSLLVNGTLLADMQAVCRQLGITENSFMMGAWAYLLSRYNNVTDVVFGSVVSGRPGELEGIASMIGLFINTIPVRIQYIPGMQVAAFLKQVQSMAIEGLPHHYLQLSEVLAQHPLGNRLFDHLVVYENYPAQLPAAAATPGSKGLQELQVLASEVVEQTNYDFTVMIGQSTDHIHVAMRYNGACYTEESVSRFKGHLENIIKAFAEDPEIALNRVAYIAPGEQQQLLYHFNTLPLPRAHTDNIVQLFKQQVRMAPDQTAIEAGMQVVSYGQLDQLSDQLANYLMQQYALLPGDITAVMLPRSEWIIIAILAVFKTGGCYVPVDPGYPADRVRFMMADTACKVCIDEEELKKFRLLKEDGPWEIPAIRIQSDHPAYIMYTSGTTGMPKGVIVTHGNVISLVKEATYVSLNSDTVILSTGSPSFDATTFEYWGTLLNGGRLVFCDESILLDSTLLKMTIDTHKVNTMWCTAGWFNQLTETEITVFENVSTLLVGGEKLSPQHIRQLQLQYPGHTLINGYGPTENTTFSLTYKIENRFYDNIPVGRPFSTRTAYILDSEQQLCAIGARGEIYVGGSGMAMGYLNNAELTAARFVNHPFLPGKKLYRTGDIGRWLPDGNIEYLGRMDEQVKIRGFRVEPGEVEYLLQQVEGVTAAVVTTQAHQQGYKLLVAYVSTAQQGILPVIKERLSARLPAYMIPAYLVEVDHFPLTANGKINKKALPRVDINQAGATEYVAARTAVEKALTDVYADVLKREHVSITDNFFELGGDSIKAILLINRLRQKGYTVKVSDVLKHPVIEQLATCVATSGRAIFQGPVKGRVELTPVQHWFLNSNYQHKHHFNQSVLLAGKEQIDEAFLRQSLAAVTAHHDALRMTYRYDGNWQQYNRGILKENFKLTVYDFRAIANSDNIMADACNALQMSMHLQKGPLLKAALFRKADGDRLLLVVHHLVIDGVSWRILLEDLSTLYEQLQHGQSLVLPLKTDSLQYWSQRLLQHSHHKSIVAQLPYWQQICQAVCQPLPVDMPGQQNQISDSMSIGFTIDEKSTHLLLTQVNQVCNTEINDLLLTALGLAVKEVFGLTKVMLKLEGHGREELLNDVNIARTIGWFTSIYPFLLDISATNNLTATLLKVKDAVRQVPDKGTGYGILYYLNHGERSELAMAVPPAITFNYLGDFGSGVSSGNGNELFSYCDEFRGDEVNGTYASETLLTVNGIVVAGTLRINITCSKKQYFSATINRLCKSYEQYLQKLVGLGDMQPDLSVTGTTTVLSPSQLKYYKAGAFAHAYGTLDFRLPSFNKERFIATYRRWLQHNEILRIRIREENGVWQQQVLPLEQPEQAITFIYSSNLDSTVEEVVSVMDTMRKTPFNLAIGEIVRCGVLYNEQEALVLMIVHHIVTDGASNSFLQDGFIALYEGTGQQAQARNSYFDFVNIQSRFLQSVAGKEKLAYWENQLKSVLIDQQPRSNKQPARQTLIINRQFITGEAYRKVVAYCKHENVLLSSFITTAFYLYFSEVLPERSSFILGITVDGRDMHLPGFDVTNVIGQFVNSIPLCLNRPTVNTFDVAIKYLQEVYLDGRLNQEIPFITMADNFKTKYGIDPGFFVDADINFFNRSDRNINPDEVTEYSKTILTDTHSTLLLTAVCHSYNNGLLVDWNFVWDQQENPVPLACTAFLNSIMSSAVDYASRELLLSIDK